MEKIPVKVKVDEIVSINLDIPREMDIYEFVGLIEKLRPFTKATQAMSISDLRQPVAVEVLDRNEEFLKEYKQYPRGERFEVLGKKYGFHSEHQMEQKFYYIRAKKKPKRSGQGFRSDLAGRGLNDRSLPVTDKNKIVEMYDRGCTAGDIAEALNIPNNKVNNYIRYMKKKGEISRKGRMSAISPLRLTKNKFKRTDAERQEIINQYRLCTTQEQRKELARRAGVKYDHLSKLVSLWKIKRGLG